jgi:dUTP pyrophosphatase
MPEHLFEHVFVPKELRPQLDELFEIYNEFIDNSNKELLLDFLRVDIERYKKMLLGFKKYGSWNPDCCVRDMAPGDFSEELVDAANYAAMQIVKVRRSCPDGGGTPRNWAKPGIRAAPGHVPLRVIRGQEAIAASQEPPKQFYVGDAGVDLVIIKDVIIFPFCVKNIRHDIRIEIPPGYWLGIRGCSSTVFKRRLSVYHCTIDNSFKGELSTSVYNPTFLPRRLRRGDRISQVVLYPLIPPEINTTDDDKQTWKVSERPHKERGEAGFGSTR